MIVVADATPIHYLVLIGEIELLEKLYKRIAIPPSVRLELLQALTPSPVRQWLENVPNWLEVISPRHSPDAALSALDDGERDAIVLAEGIGANLLVIDELKGRRIAEFRGLAVIGTLGVLRDASSLELTNLSSALDRLSQTSFHLSPRLLERIRGRQ